MQSSTAIAFRALVMLICLISIPLFAIFGRDLPEVVKNLLSGRLVIKVTDTASGTKTASAPAANGNNPLSTPTAPVADVSPYRSAPAAAGNVAATPPAAHSLAMGTGNGPGSEPPGNWRADTVAAAPAQPAGFQAPAETKPMTPPASGANETAMGRAPEIQQGTAAAAVSASSSTSDEQFRRAEARLRELGATHYTLETWGSDNNRYRFVCKMALAGNPGVNRYFQAIEDDPWRAMNAVLQQVETWRAQQPQQ